MLLVALLLIISIILEQIFIAPILPWLSELGSIRPMIVFLDIPLSLPAIDPLPVSILFALFYFIAPSSGLTRGNPPAAGEGRVWKAVTGLWMLLILFLVGGGLFYLTQDYLPKNVTNGIDSFGVRADLTLPYPSGDLIHLHGSVVMLVFSGIGIQILRRRTSIPVPAYGLTLPEASRSGTRLPEAPKAALARTTSRSSSPAKPRKAPLPSAPALSASAVSTSGDLIHANFLPEASEAFAAQHARYMPPATPKTKSPAATPPVEKRYRPVTITSDNGKPSTAAVTAPASSIATPTPEPATTTRSYVQKPAILTPEPAPTCRLTTPPPIAMVMPRPAPGVGKMHPCFIIGGLKPTKGPSTPL